MIYRFWFIVNLDMPYGPENIGVSSYTVALARKMIRGQWELITSLKSQAEIDELHYIKDIDVRLLDANHVQPNMGVVVGEGITIMHLQKLLLLVSLLIAWFLPNAWSQEQNSSTQQDLKHSSHIAQFPGGEAGWFKTVEERISYQSFPQGISRNTISIVVKFLVSRDGNIRDISFCSGDHRIEASVRTVLLRSGDWLAAIQGGRSVHSYRKVKFQFRFDGTIKKWILDRSASAYLIL